MTDAMGVLIELAAPQHGMFRVDQAATLGLSGARIRKLAAQGKLDRLTQGVYRLPTFPINEHTELMEAVLWAKGRGVIAGETALGLWDLADVNGRKIHLVVPPRYRPKAQGGTNYKVHHQHLTADDTDEVHGIPTVTPAIAIRQATNYGLAGDLIEQAIARAHAREHIGTETAARLRVHLYDRNRPHRARL